MVYDLQNMPILEHRFESAQLLLRLPCAQCLAYETNAQHASRHRLMLGLVEGRQASIYLPTRARIACGDLCHAAQIGLSR